MQKDKEFKILFANNLGKIISRRICGIARKFRVISPKMNEAMLFSTQRKRATSNSIWDPVPELTITSPYVHSRVNSYTCTPWATLCQSRLFSPVRDFGFALCLMITSCIYTVLCFGQWYIIPPPPFQCNSSPTLSPPIFRWLCRVRVWVQEGGGGYEGLGCTTSYLASGPSFSRNPPLFRPARSRDLDRSAVTNLFGRIRIVLKCASSVHPQIRIALLIWMCENTYKIFIFISSVLYPQLENEIDIIHICTAFWYKVNTICKG